MSCKKKTCKANALLKIYGATINNSDFTPAKSLLGYILKIDNLLQTVREIYPNDQRYYTFEEMLLDIGQFFEPGISAKKYRQDISNRFRYAAHQQSEENIYVEGICLKQDGKAVEHAWILNIKSGKMSDVFFHGQAYFGIPLNHHFVDEWNNGYGVFSEKTNGADLLVRGLPGDAIYKPNKVDNHETED